jgi:purine nucleoside phosphorylase
MVFQKLTETVKYIRSITPTKPRVGITLGSGLGAFVKEVEVEKTIPYPRNSLFQSTDSRRPSRKFDLW